MITCSRVVERGVDRIRKTSDIDTMLREVKPSHEEQWKIYETSQHYIDDCNQRQWDQDAKFDRWMLTLAGGSFGLSFAFIGNIVSVDTALSPGLLIAAWACFAAVLVIELAGFMISSFVHSGKAAEERKNIFVKYNGETPEYKDRGIFSNVNAVLGYAALLSFAGGVICLLLFVAKNLVN